MWCVGSNIQSFCGYIKQLPVLEQNVVRKKLHTRRDRDGDDMYVCCCYKLSKGLNHCNVSTDK